MINLSALPSAGIPLSLAVICRLPVLPESELTLLFKEIKTDAHTLLAPFHTSDATRRCALVNAEVHKERATSTRFRRVRSRRWSPPPRARAVVRAACSHCESERALARSSTDPAMNRRESGGRLARPDRWRSYAASRGLRGLALGVRSRCTSLDARTAGEDVDVDAGTTTSRS